MFLKRQPDNSEEMHLLVQDLSWKQQKNGIPLHYLFIVLYFMQGL